MDETAPRPLHVGYVLTVFPRLSETFILREILELERLGVQVTIFSQKRPLEHRVHAELADLRARIIYLSPWVHTFFPTLFAHVATAAQQTRRYNKALTFARSRFNAPTLKKFWRAPMIAREVRRSGIQLLHCHFMSSNTRLGRLASLMSGIPYSITAHAKDIYGSGLSDRKMARRLEEASFVVTISRLNFDYLSSKAFRARIELLPNAVDTKALLFTQRAINSGSPNRILAVGRLVEKKGFHILIAALAIARQRGNQLTMRIVGDGGERTALERLVADHNLQPYVQFTGALTQQELRTHFDWADLLVVPSVATESGDIDGCPVVILEAMALGVPVIASRLSGIPEVVLHEQTALLIEPGNSDLLATAIQQASMEHLTSLAANARRFIEEHHDIRRTARRLHKLMKKHATGPRDE